MIQKIEILNRVAAIEGLIGVAMANIELRMGEHGHLYRAAVDLDHAMRATELLCDELLRDCKAGTGYIEFKRSMFKMAAQKEFDGSIKNSSTRRLR